MNFESQDPDLAEDERRRDSSRKRDGKRDKKEKGYQMFEEEDSEEDQLVLAEELKSPSKSKIGKAKPSFKFPVRKEKTKEKEEKKDKDTKKEDKDKRRGEKEGKKPKKDKKKSKHASAPTVVVPSQCENPIFGVPLAAAVERNKSHDGIEVPAIVRECIDYIEECGLACEGIYRISGVKSKVQHLKDMYNRHESVYLYEHEPNVVASLLKQFLRDLPEPVLTTALLPKFEEASVIKNNSKKVEAFYRLICDLPTCNRLLLSWMIVHMTHVIDLAKENKMPVQNVSIVLSPTMQISHRVLYVLFSNVNQLFGNVTLRKYVPPLKPAHSKWSLELPDNPAALEEELAKQESLLNQLHVDLNSGLTDPVIEEQLWEVQRVVTQLKRKIKMAKKSVEMGERRKATLDMKRSSQTSIPSLSAPEELRLELRTAPDPAHAASPNVTTVTAVVERLPGEGGDSPEGKVSTPQTADPARRAVKFAIEPEVETCEDTSEQQGEQKPCVEEKGKGDAGSEEKVEVVEDKEAAQERAEVSDKDSEDVVMRSKEDKAGESKSETDVAPGKTETESERQEITSRPSSVLKQADPPTEAPVAALETSQKDIPQIDEQQKRVPPMVRSPSIVEDVTLPQKTIQLPEAVAVKRLSEDRSRDATAPSQTPPVSSQTPPVPSQTPPVPSQTPPVPSQTTAALSQAEPATEDGLEGDKKPHLPPFMSTTLLQPMKAEIPKPKPSPPASKKEILIHQEKLRELEEELLGEKRKKAISETESERDSEEEIAADDRDMEDILEEEYGLQMEEEELLAIADELKQKMATERSEMERLTQEIQELQYLRQDSDLEDVSSSSNSSDDSEDEEDLQDLLGQLIHDNQNLEMRNADLCQKIHEERMICLSVKLQIRLLQQRQMENTYG